MKRLIFVSLFATAAVATGLAVAAESEMLTQLDKALDAVAKFEYGGDSGPLNTVESMVVSAATDTELSLLVEQRLIRTIASSATRDAKGFLCRQLRTIGSARCVPELEKLLSDAELSHMARYALGSIEDPAAAAALRRALGATRGRLRVGIINTLADRRDRRALPDVVRLLGSADSAVAEASARALGRIGGAEAVEALEGARAKASGSLGHTIDNALLFCAEGFVAEGRTGEAAKIYEGFYRSPDQPGHFRLAGLRGLVAARGPKAAPLLVEAVGSDNPDLQRSAIACMALVKGPEATKAFAEILPSLQPQAQELVVRALGARGDGAAERAISVAAKSPDERVRIAALEALGQVGGASAAYVLAEAAAAAGGTEQQVARAALVRLRRAGVDRTLVRSIGSGDSKVRVEMIRAVAGRGLAQATNELFSAARDGDEDVRREAIRALGLLAGESQLPSLVELVVKPKDGKDRAAIEQAVASVFRRIPSKDEQAGPVLAAFADAPADARATLLRLLGRPATPRALGVVRGAVNDVVPEIRDAAIRTLADWPDASPADDLLALARTSADRTHKIVALRGYVRMAGMSDRPTAMYVRAMELAESADDKKLVLAGLGTSDSAEALNIAERYIEDERLRAEAALAVVQIADRLRQNDPTRAKEALKNVTAKVTDRTVRRKSRDIINEMEQYEGYILLWQASGPYTIKGKESREVFETAFEPEKPDSGDAEWKPLKNGVGSWDIDLESTFGSKDHVGAYVRTRIWSPAEAAARLELGSDDAIKVWLNAKLVHEVYTSRGLTARQDLVDVKLKEGWNVLLLKVVDHAGGWAFCCRVRRPDGSAFDGLKIEAK